MGRTKTPHVVFYMDGGCVEGVLHEVGARAVRRSKTMDVKNRAGRFDAAPSFHLIIYSGRLGEDLKYVETA